MTHIVSCLLKKESLYLIVSWHITKRKCKLLYETQYTPVLMSVKGKICMNYWKTCVIFSATFFPIHILQCTGAGKQWLVIMAKHMLTEVKCLLTISYFVSHSSLLSHFSVMGKDEGLIQMCLLLWICVIL